MDELFPLVLQVANEILTAAIVVIATSLLLYNLTRNLSNRVARTSGIVLACVTIAYVMDVFVSLGPDLATYEAALRLQWIGIALIPAALFHLSDALLATTGLPSRGRRRRVARILYLIATVFLLTAAFSDVMVQPVHGADDIISMQARPIFWLYLAFFFITNTATFINVNRARQRCRTRSTERRMAYLQAAILMPALGIFPYSVLLAPGQEFSLLGLIGTNVANVTVVFMLIFLSYPLSFFGSDVPDRVVKVELLRFLLRGPGTGMMALSVIILTTRATRILSLPGEDFMPFAVVAMVLFWEWMVHLALPFLERWLIYDDEDDEQLALLQDLSNRLLTRNDLLQLLGATLAATCDYLRVRIAFIFSLKNDQIDVVQTVGAFNIVDEDLQQQREALMQRLSAIKRHFQPEDIPQWRRFWLFPLYSTRSQNGSSGAHLIGIMGLEATSDTLELDMDERQMLMFFIRRAEQTLDDMLLQQEISAALEGLIPQLHMTRSRAEEVEYRPGRQQQQPAPALPDPHESFEQVRAALRHYWGGPGMANSRLLDWQIVQDTVERNGDSPLNALRNILQEAIERQRPEGERSMTAYEWTLYNLLDLRFLEGKKVRDVARRMGISEGDLYRKQRAAIEALTETLIDMEREHLQAGINSAPPEADPSPPGETSPRQQQASI